MPLCFGPFLVGGSLGLANTLLLLDGDLALAIALSNLLWGWQWAAWGHLSLNMRHIVSYCLRLIHKHGVCHMRHIESQTQFGVSKGRVCSCVQFMGVWEPVPIWIKNKKIQFSQFLSKFYFITHNEMNKDLAVNKVCITICTTRICALLHRV